MHYNSLSRRAFLGTAAANAAIPKSAKASRSVADRRESAFQVRLDAAQYYRTLPVPEQVSNGDEEAYPNKIGSFSKGLPHHSSGEVDLSAYNAFIRALSSGRNADFESVPMGALDSSLQRKLVNPQAGLAFELEGADSHQLSIPPAPKFNSAEEAGEAVEAYWLALLRDMPFTAYESSPLVAAAVEDLSKLSDFRGPRTNGLVTPATLFRGFTPGDVAGPYLSQFLVKPIPFGPQYVEQRMRTVLPEIDYGTQYDEWLNIQNGVRPDKADRFATTRCLIRNGRDLAAWVHIDVLFQAYFNAGMMLLTREDASDELIGGGMGAPLNPGNPYSASRTQDGFGTFGAPYIATQIGEVAVRALKAAWFQKWFVHRRLRPEEFAGRVHNKITGAKPEYPIHPDVLNSTAAARVFSKYGTYLLPLAFPEGSPVHPSYGAGHATVAGGCVTMLKALFDETYVIPNPVVPSEDGSSVVPYKGPDAEHLTVGGELNKLTANIGIGRNFAGVHWRSDYAESVRLGEAVAISVLRDQRATYSEEFSGFTFTKFDGEKVTV